MPKKFTKKTIQIKVAWYRIRCHHYTSPSVLYLQLLFGTFFDQIGYFRNICLLKNESFCIIDREQIGEESKIGSKR